MATLQQLKAIFDELDIAQQLKVIFDELDTNQFMVISVLASLLLIMLIFLAFKRRKSKRSALGAGRQTNQYDKSNELGIDQSQSEMKHAKVSAFVETGSSVTLQTAAEPQSASQSDESAQIPEDSVLRRHYLANQAAQEEALHNPYPSDSVLRRHYDAAHKMILHAALYTKEQTESDPSLISQSTAQASVISRVPEDSVLRRHYLANEAAKEAALHNPYPTDSVLRRHYDALHKLVAESSSHSTAEVTSTSKAPTKDAWQKASIIEQAIGKASPAIHPVQTITPVTQAAQNSTMRMDIPQDSVLNRHFISQLRAEIEANMAGRPTDSVLRRHYDSLVSAELDRRLSS